MSNMKSYPNAIFALNDDCLAEIFSYLPIEDVIHIYKSDTRFRGSSCLRFAHGGIFCIDREINQTWPKDAIVDYTEAFGRVAHTFEFKEIPEEKFFEIIPNFTVLKVLILSDMDITDGPDKVAALPVQLEHLEIHRCCISENILQQWIPQLNPTLTHLRVTFSEKMDSLESLKGLSNITSIHVNGMIKSSPLVLEHILANNKEHMDQLTMLNDGQTIIPKGIWKSIIRMDKLTYLHLDQSKYEGYIPPEHRLFPNLKWIQVSFGFSQLRSVIDRLASEDARILCTPWRLRSKW